jgi:phage-related protein
MATGTRALTLKLIADIDDFNKNLNKGSTEVEGFGGKIEKFGKVAAAAFAAAAAAAVAYAGKLAIDGVKAAIEDEAAQVRLAGALERATGATRDQIAAVEQQITKTALATGVADDQLRPALARLAISTGDTAKAQDLLNLALDVAQATGKPVETVANALGKAYDGNTAALGKLGIGLSAAELKTMSFTDVQGKLSDLFGGAAAANAQTFQGRMDRLKVAFDEAKETIGFALLPIIERLVSFVVNQVVPNLQKFASAFDPIVKAINDNKDSFQKLFNFIGDYVIPILSTLAGGALKVVGEVFGKIIGIIGAAIDKIAAFVESVKNMVNAVISAYNRLPLPNISLVGGGGGAVGGAPGAISGVGSNAAILSAVTGLSGITSGISGLAGAAGGKAGTSANKAAFAKLQADAEMLGALVDQLTGANQYASTFTSDSAAARAERAFQAQPINITVNGAIDSESTARQIVEILNDSAARGTVGAGKLNLLP